MNIYECITIFIKIVLISINIRVKFFNKLLNRLIRSQHFNHKTIFRLIRHELISTPNEFLKLRHNWAQTEKCDL